MPGSRTQRFLGWIGGVGLFTACFGCSLLWRNEMTAGNVFLIAAWLILVPLFLYLISARRRTKRVVRSREVTTGAQRQAELDALGEAFGPGAGGDGEQTTTGDRR